MFGIGGGELILIIFIALMLFGSEKIPDVARTLGKIVAQVKNATNDIKHEINKSAQENNIDVKSLTGDFQKEVDELKQGITNKITSEESGSSNPLSISKEINEVKENFEDLTGPIKRQM